MKYKILHLPTGTYIYRSAIYCGNNITFGEFFSEVEIKSHTNNAVKKYINIFEDKNVLIELKDILRRYYKSGGAYILFDDVYNKNHIDRIEHFELIEVNDV